MTVPVETEGLIVRTEEPFNAETPLCDHPRPITPNERFFVRSHFSVPDRWPGLTVDGAVEREMILDVEALSAYPRQDVVVTLECAGNGRWTLDPQPAGVPWRLGAVSTAVWSGVPLRSILTKAGLRDDAVNVRFEGADRGHVAGHDEEIPFGRSLTVADALALDVLLADRMNGTPLPVAHGGPLRLVVPGWYGMASVKWLERITALNRPYQGHYQVVDYVTTNGRDESRPCREMQVRSVIVSHEDGTHIEVGAVELRGFAWSGRGLVQSVEFSSDGGANWQSADLGHQESPVSWVEWSATWLCRRTGTHELLVRARDVAGNVQPLGQAWTENGYENNACQRVSVTAV